MALCPHCGEDHELEEFAMIFALVVDGEQMTTMMAVRITARLTGVSEAQARVMLRSAIAGGYIAVDKVLDDGTAVPVDPDDVRIVH